MFRMRVCVSDFDGVRRLSEHMTVARVSRTKCSAANFASELFGFPQPSLFRFVRVSVLERHCLCEPAQALSPPVRSGQCSADYIDGALCRQCSADYIDGHVAALLRLLESARSISGFDGVRRLSEHATVTRVFRIKSFEPSHIAMFVRATNSACELFGFQPAVSLPL